MSGRVGLVAPQLFAFISHYLPLCKERTPLLYRMGDDASPPTSCLNFQVYRPRTEPYYLFCVQKGGFDL